MPHSIGSELSLPAAVREACQLVACAWLISTVPFLMFFFYQPYGSSADRYSMVLLAAVASIAFSLPRFWLLRKIWKRRRWSRLALLALLGLEWTWWGSSVWSSSLSELDPLATTAKAASVILEIFAITLLFSAGASAWFNSASQVQQAERGAA